MDIKEACILRDECEAQIKQLLVNLSRRLHGSGMQIDSVEVSTNVWSEFAGERVVNPEVRVGMEIERRNYRRESR